MTFIQHLLRALALIIKLHFPIYKTQQNDFGIAITRELNRRSEKKKIQQKYSPPKLKRVRKEILRGGYRGSRPKDKRYSSQRALRRMYRNS